VKHFVSKENEETFLSKLTMQASQDLKTNDLDRFQLLPPGFFCTIFTSLFSLLSLIRSRIIDSNDLVNIVEDYAERKNIAEIRTKFSDHFHSRVDRWKSALGVSTKDGIFGGISQWFHTVFSTFLSNFCPGVDGHVCYFSFFFFSENNGRDCEVFVDVMQAWEAVPFYPAGSETDVKVRLHGSFEKLFEDKQRGHLVRRWALIPPFPGSDSP